MAGLFDAFQDDVPSDFGEGGLLSLIKEQAAYRKPVSPEAQPPQQAEQLFPSTPQDFGRHLIAGLSGFSNGVRNGGMLSGILGGINGLSTGVPPEDRQRMRLPDVTLIPGSAQTIPRDRELMRIMLPRILGLSGKASGVRSGISWRGK
ncbi:hypothetical protein [Bradyrhizobium sp. SYSU BS000235]|uniref:hypothetical protein n=1 Tax=Bradyrhizobium sp. SYSU BS000235 TaxID=3411332 RepID=UPI003C70DA2B